MGGHYQVGLRFTDKPNVLHTGLHHDFDTRSQLEVRMLERGNLCEVVSVETKPSIRATELHTKQRRLG